MLQHIWVLVSGFIIYKKINLTLSATGLWMQDKPALQQRLSREFASLVYTLHTAVILPFIRAFWITIAREWGHIEALRLDKFLFLIRQYVHTSFQLLSRNKWKKGLVEDWNKIMEEVPLECKDMKIPNGLRYHVLDVLGR